MALFREPWVIGLIVILVVLLFAGPKLPGLAKSLGQSMRIFRKEVKQMKDENAPEATTSAAKDEAADETKPTPSA